MNSLLRDLLAQTPCVVADGAMGTNLFRLGLSSGDAPELWNLEHPERVGSVHRDFVEAGSEILLTNSFGANRYRLALHGAQERVLELNRAAAEVARSTVRGRDRPVLVAGSMGPTGEILEPLGSLAFADAAAAFAEQAQGLAEGGCDLIWIETISSLDELDAALAGAARTGLPMVATMSFDTHGRTMMGTRPEDALAFCRALEHRPVAFGANCGIGPAHLVESILALAPAAAPDELLVAKGNCGMPRYDEGAIVYDGTPEVMADYACLARDAGASIIGGCCGTGPEHVRAMADALRTRPRRASPSRDEITRQLGPIDGPVPDGEARGERRGRRRRSDLSPERETTETRALPRRHRPETGTV